MYPIRSIFLMLAVTASMLVVTSIAVTPAKAVQVNVTFSGVVTTANSTLLALRINPPFAESQPLNGSFIYEDSILDSAGSIDDGTGRYNRVVQSMTLNFGSGAYVATMGSAGSNFIEILHVGTLQDTYVMRAPAQGNLIDDRFPLSFQMVIDHKDLSGGLSGSDTLVPPSLGNFVSGTPFFKMTFENHGFLTSFDGKILSVSSAVVPLPPAVILFGAGLVVLIGLGARNWRLNGSGVA